LWNCGVNRNWDTGSKSYNCWSYYDLVVGISNLRGPHRFLIVLVRICYTLVVVFFQSDNDRSLVLLHYSSILCKVNGSHNGFITLLGETLCFRFCNKLPSFTVCALSEVCDNVKVPFSMKLMMLTHVFLLSLFGNNVNRWLPQKHHIFMISLQCHFQHPMQNQSRTVLNKVMLCNGSLSF